MPRDHSNREGGLSLAASSRRRFMRAAAAGVPIAVAGCLGDPADDDDDGNGNGNGDEGNGNEGNGNGNGDDGGNGNGDDGENGNGNGNDTDAEPAADEEGDPVSGGELLWGGSVPVQTLDPHLESAAASHQVLENITQGLVRVNWDYELEPALAEEWETSEDNTEITFSLREGVSFHDGSEFVADDVVASFERIEEREALAYDYVSFIDTIDAPDDYTVEITLTEPFAPLLSRMATAYMHVVPAEQAEQSRIEEPIGTGPFQFESQELDSEFVMTGFEDYWDEELPYLDRITKDEIPDNDVRLDRFEAGEVDFINDVPPRHAEDLADDPDVDFIERFPQSLTYLGLNCTEEPFDNRDARIALDYAIDKEEVLEAALYGNGRVAASPGAPDSEWEHPDLEPRPQDFDQAQEHLEEAGYPDGFEATFQIPQDYNDQVNAAQVIESHAAQVGIELDIQQITWSNWLGDVYEEQNFQATTSSYLALWYPDAAYHNFLHPDGALFFTGWENEEYNDLVDEARRVYEVEERAPLYHDAAEILQEDRSGHILLYWMPTLMVRDPSYKGEVASPDGSTFRFEDTWLEE